MSSEKTSKLADKPFGTYSLGTLHKALLYLARKTLLGRGKARRLLWPLFEKNAASGFDVPVRNYVMRLFPLNNTVERKLLFRPDRYCPDEINFLTQHLSGSSQQNPMSFVDVGANIGALTLPVASHPHTKIIAVEPEPNAFDRLSFNLQANQFDHVILEKVALSDQAGTTEFISHTSDLKLSGINGRWSKGETIQVSTTTLQHLMDKHGLNYIDVLKIDVEGHEDQILLTFFEHCDATRWPKNIIIEAIEREGLPDCIDYMYQHGYTKTFQNRANLCLTLST